MKGSAPALQLKVTHRGEGLLMAHFGPVCIATWTTKPTPNSFEIQRAQLAAAVERNPQRQFFLCVVTPSADAPDQAVRDASAKMITGHREKLAGCACVIEGSGFRAAITRTVLTGIVLIIRGPSPVTFFESVSSATVWLQKRADGSNLHGLGPALQLARDDARSS